MGFQVFINHRGPDTKKTLASSIYYRLKNQGLRVFFDDKELETGDIIDVALEEAIKSSSVYIALFSQRYAESRYCLNELCQMMKRLSRERRFIPVFADILPCHLRGIDRPPYGDAFSKHHTKFPFKVVEEWKKALQNAADISGVVFKTGESDLGEFLEHIAKLVLKALKRDVEVEEPAEDFQNKFKNQSELLNTTKMGGLSKSTPARSDSSRSGFQKMDDEVVSSSKDGTSAPERSDNRRRGYPPTGIDGAGMVFINHREPDTQRRVVSPIHHKLTRQGLRVFFDREDLCGLKEVDSAIQRAITSASVYIALFSPRYAESQACLKELSIMMKKRSRDNDKIITVFFDVEPYHLKGVDRPPYAAAFTKHQDNVSVEVVNGWKKALREAADISGLVFKTGESDLEVVIETIVKSVSEAIKQDRLRADENPVGLDKATEDFQRSELYTINMVFTAEKGDLKKSRGDSSRSVYWSDYRNLQDPIPSAFQRKFMNPITVKLKAIGRLGKSNLARPEISRSRDDPNPSDLEDSESMEQVYQVFINHRGPDTQRRLVSPIHDQLTRQGLRVFYDRAELYGGNEVDPASERAIKSASIYIALFSPRYAESPACLKELCMMMMKRSRDNRKIITVFFDVKPYHLMGVDRPPYAEAFANHQDNVSGDVVKGWKKALREAADISGLVFKTGESELGVVMEKIVKSVSEAIKRDPLRVR